MAETPTPQDAIIARNTEQAAERVRIKAEHAARHGEEAPGSGQAVAAIPEPEPESAPDTKAQTKPEDKAARGPRE